MKLFKRFTILFIIIILSSSGIFVESTQATERSVDSIIVKFKKDIEPKKIILSPKDKIDDLIARYNKRPDVEYAEANVIYKASIIPSDTYYTNQWYLNRIDAFEAWNLKSSSPNITIAIIDSGVQIDHPDLASNIWVNKGEVPNNKKDDDKNGLVDDVNGWDFVNNLADPSPKFKNGFTEGGIIHGTIVSGIAAASGNNNQGVAGITWKTNIMALKALDDQGNGDTMAVIKAIDYAVNKGANIINLSFVGFNYSRALEDAIKRAYNAGVIVVAAAGNEQSAVQGVNLNNRPAYPACYRDTNGKKLVIGVAATDGLDQKASFSGFGEKCIDITAPGISFFSTSVYAPYKSSAGKFFNQMYDGYLSGTSMAVPIISGTLALIQGANPTLSASEVVSILLSSADDINLLNPVYYGQLGSGRVNVSRAILNTVMQLRQKRAHFVFGPIKGAPIVSTADSEGFKEKEFLAYKESFQGGVNVATGDFNSDGNDEIVTAPIKDLESDIKIFSADGKMINHFLAYPYNFKGGVNLVVADINNDNRVEIITAPASGYEPLVKIFNSDGKLLYSFLAYPSSFKGGVSLAIGDVRDDSNNEIITVPGKGGIPQVKIFSSKGKLLNHFLLGQKNENYGYKIALGDLDGNPRRRQKELIISRQNGLSIVKTFDFRGNFRKQWMAYSSAYNGSVNLASGDLNRDGFTDIITVPGPQGAPHVRVFDYQGEINFSFYAFDPTATNGLTVALLMSNN